MFILIVASYRANNGENRLDEKIANVIFARRVSMAKHELEFQVPGFQKKNLHGANRQFALIIISTEGANETQHRMLSGMSTADRRTKREDCQQEESRLFWLRKHRRLVSGRPGAIPRNN